MNGDPQKIRRFALMLGLSSFASGTLAGSFSSSTESAADIITHPEGYRGTGGELNLTVCIADNSQDQTALEIPVQNALRTWNELQPTNGNFVENTLSGFDIESVLLHELGHCIGLGHTNLGSEVSASNRNFSRSANGANNSFSFNLGADNIAGSADDIRGDDVNLVWFRRSNNNPFGMAQTIDTSTYSVMLADLPIGDSYAAIAGRSVGAALGFPNTEAVMHQGTFSQEAQRNLGFDDVATIRIGMSGADETQDTADDYSFTLTYTGIQDSNNCDIPIRIVPGSSSFAVCFASSTSSQLPSNHRRLLFTRIEFGGTIDWYFNDTLNVIPDTDEDGLSDALEGATCTDTNDADTDDDGLADGVEDANQNGIVDPGETDPCDADSDNDDIQDGTELGVVAGVTDTNLSIFIPDSDPTTTTLPLESDTDGDGLDDGVEDPNFNGEVDPGESDPNDENSPPSPTTVPLMPLLFQLLAGGLLLLVSLIGLKSLRSK